MKSGLAVSMLVGLLLTAAAGCRPTPDTSVFKDPTYGPLQVNILPAEHGIRIEMVNSSDRPIGILTPLEPEYDIVRLSVMDRHGTFYKESRGVDWLVFDEDVVTLAPRRKFSQEVSLKYRSLKPGQYRIQAVYAVTTDSFFVEPWLKDMLTDRGPEFQATKRRMQALWFGTAISPVTDVLVTDAGGEPAKPRSTVLRRAP